MGFFQDKMMRYLPPFYKENDTYLNPEFDNKGILERLMSNVIGWFFDALQDKIDLFPKETIDPDGIYLPFVPYMEQGLGVNLFYSKDVEKRKQVLKYFVRISQIKGSKRGYEVCFRLAGFLDITVLTFDIFVDFDNPLPSAGCDACYEYDILITTTRDFFYIDDVEAFYAVSKYNEPINAKLRDIIHNGLQLTTDYVFFFLQGIDSPNLRVELYRNTTFQARIEDSTGELLIDDPLAAYYQYDDEYFFNKGKMLILIPNATFIEPFESLPPNNITRTSFRARWNTAPDAVSYILNVGTSLTESLVIENVIGNKVIDSLNVGNVTNVFATGLTEHTCYYYQVLALRSDGNFAYSKPQAVITKRTVPSPTNLRVFSQSNYSALITWDAVSIATAWRYDIATDAGFSNLVEDNVLIQGRATTLRIELPNPQNYYVRVRAVYNRADGFYEDFAECIESVSVHSNVLHFDMASIFVEHTEDETMMEEAM